MWRQSSVKVNMDEKNDEAGSGKHLETTTAFVVFGIVSTSFGTRKTFTDIPVSSVRSPGRLGEGKFYNEVSKTLVFLYALVGSPKLLPPNSR